MPKKKPADMERLSELLEKQLIVQLHTLGASQNKIAQVVGRQTAWVNALLKGLPKEG